MYSPKDDEALFIGGALRVEGTGSSVAAIMDKLRVVRQARMLRTSRGPKASITWKPGKRRIPNRVGGTTLRLVTWSREERQEDALSCASPACVNTAKSILRNERCMIVLRTIRQEIIIVIRLQGTKVTGENYAKAFVLQAQILRVHL